MHCDTPQHLDSQAYDYYSPKSGKTDQGWTDISAKATALLSLIWKAWEGR